MVAAPPRKRHPASLGTSPERPPGDHRRSPLPEPITIRITDEALSPLDAEIRVATPEGTRRVTGDRVTLSSDELVERADVVVAAPGLAPFAVSTFARDDYAALPQLEGNPAIALAPLLVTDRLEVRVSTRGGAFVSTDPLGHGSGFAFGITVEDDWRDYDDDNPPTGEVPGSVPLTYSFGVVPTS